MVNFQLIFHIPQVGLLETQNILLVNKQTNPAGAVSVLTYRGETYCFDVQCPQCKVRTKSGMRCWSLASTLQWFITIICSIANVYTSCGCRRPSLSPQHDPGVVYVKL
jgi:nitrite reductase/ring-hydroxylating ferredoxin subunit